MSKYSLNFFLAIVLSLVFSSARSSDYLIGTYYFPGWTTGARGLSFPVPWQPIKKFPEKEPLLGWYSDSDPAVLKQQTKWMKDYGIDFVAFDWYWDGQNTYMDHALNAFRSSKVSGDMKFTLLWANHYKFPGGMPEFRLMVRYWIARYFSDVDFLKIDGKPVVFVFGLDYFDAAAKALGVTPAELINVANALAQESGFLGIYFVGGTPALEHWVKGVAPAARFSGISAYNYHMGYSGTAQSALLTGEGYMRYDNAYRANWNWLISNSSLQYVIPMTSGWDFRPWAAPGTNHKSFLASPEQFESHLQEAKRLMDSYPDKTKRMGIICCWNEFGEGSYIEPTKKDGFQYLEKVKKVFGSP